MELDRESLKPENAGIQNFISAIANRQFNNLKTNIMDDKSKTGKSDDARINVGETYELQYWSQQFDVTPERLREAVSVVGPIAENVRNYLKRDK